MIEGFINAAFFVTQPVEVSQRALKHKDYAAWKHMNRVIGTGEFAFTLSTDPDPKASAALMFPEFAGKGQGSWSMLDAPSKIDRNRESSPVSWRGLARRLWTDIRHLFGGHPRVSVRYELLHERTQPRRNERRGLSCQYREPSGRHSLCCQHAASGFLAAFAQIHNCLPLIDVERKLFKRLYKAAQSEDFGRDSSSSAEEQD